MPYLASLVVVSFSSIAAGGQTAGHAAGDHLCLLTAGSTIAERAAGDRPERQCEGSAFFTATCTQPHDLPCCTAIDSSARRWMQCKPGSHLAGTQPLLGGRSPASQRHRVPSGATRSALKCGKGACSIGLEWLSEIDHRDSRPTAGAAASTPVICTLRSLPSAAHQKHDADERGATTAASLPRCDVTLKAAD